MGTNGKFRLAVLFILVLLPGCLGNNPAAPTRFYLLDPLSLGKPLETAGQQMAIELRSLDLPQYLEKPQIVIRTSANRLELAEYHQWGGNLRKNIIRVLKQNLSAILATPHVTSPPFVLNTSPDVRIKIEVMAFEADHLGRVILRAQWRIFSGASNDLLASEISDFQRPAEASGRDKDKIVMAMNRILADFSLTLARAVLKTAGKG
jgi:uncharacterized lipoprotein YmbA